MSFPRNTLAILNIAFSAMIFSAPAHAQDNKPTLEPLRIGWIGPMSGPCTKYGAFQAAQLALEDINAAGGVNGRPVEFLYEDGRCDGKSATSAAMKLISADHVRYIMGGHNSPESMPIAPLADRNKVVILAAITSSPKFSNTGAYASRCTMVSLQGADAIAKYIKDSNAKKLAVLFSETEYAMPVAERVRDDFIAGNGKVVMHESFAPAETDFRTILTRIKGLGADALFLGTQSPETAGLVLTQMKQLGMSLAVFGNETTGNAVASDKSHDKSLFEGVTFAEPEFNREKKSTKEYIERYNRRFGTTDLPYGIWTAEAYDCPRVLVNAISRCGDDPDKVKDCLREVRDYDGVSGTFSISKNGDGERPFQIKKIANGIAVAVVP